MPADENVTILLNGEPVTLAAAPHDTLLEVLRRERITSARESCGQGVCGTCTVLVDERTVASCILPARLADGTTVETAEGMGLPGDLGVVQQAFVAESGFQCGFCTPGMVVTATELLRENPDPSDAEIRHHLAGNLCRCGAYPEILAAVRTAARMLAADVDPEEADTDVAHA